MSRYAKIRQELRDLQAPLSRLAAKSEDAAKAEFEAYKKKHPGTKKTPKDFLEKGEAKSPPAKGKSQSKKTVGDNDLIAAGDNLVLLSSFAKNHIKGTHNKPGKGSVFNTSVKDADLEKAISGIPKDFLEKGGGVYEVKVPNAGYDLVKSSKDILDKYPNAKKVTVVKEERGKPIEVTGYVVDNDIEDFATDTVSVVVRPTTEQSRQYLPEDVQKDGDMDSAIKGGKAFAVLSSWPGKGDIPPTSQWGDDYAVIIPNGGKGADTGDTSKKAFSKTKYARIAQELKEIRRELSRLAADKSPTKDGAQALFDAYKKKHPNTEKTVQDFYEPKTDESNAGSSQRKNKSLDERIKKNPKKKQVVEAMKRAEKLAEGDLKVIEKPSDLKDAFNSASAYKKEGTKVSVFSSSTGTPVESLDLDQSVVNAPKIERCRVEKSVIWSSSYGSGAALKNCKVDKSSAIVRDATKTVFTDSEVILPETGVFDGCKFKGSTKIVGDPKAMVFINCSFEDPDYMDDLMADGAGFGNEEEKSEFVSNAEKYWKSLPDK